MELLAEYIKELDVEKRHLYTHPDDEAPEGYSWITFSCDHSARKLIGRIIQQNVLRDRRPIMELGNVEPRGFTMGPPSEVFLKIEVFMKSNAEIDAFYSMTWGTSYTMEINGVVYDNCRIIEQNATIEHSHITVMLDVRTVGMKRYPEFADTY